MMGAMSYSSRHWLCKESTIGPTVEPTKNSFAVATFGGNSGGRDDIFIAIARDRKDNSKLCTYDIDDVDRLLIANYIAGVTLSLKDKAAH